MTSLGAVFLPHTPPERFRDVVLAAEDGGLEQLWLWEDCFLTSGVAAAAAALGWTERLQVGIGLMPVPLRNVALTAMEVATLARLFPGRIRPGVGHGVLDWMAQVGARAPSPMTLLREYVLALRELLDGASVTTDGRYVHLDAVALDWPPESRPPLYVGAVKARTLQLAGELADGTILTAGTTAGDVAGARVLIDEGRAARFSTGSGPGLARSSTAAGREDRHEIVVNLKMAFGPDAEGRLSRDADRSGLMARPAPGVAGDAARIADEVGRYAGAGADVVVLQPTREEPDPAAFVRFVAEQVRPLIR